MVGHHICNEWSLCHYTTINDQNNETHGITKGTILFPIYATNCDGSLARDEDHKTITLTKCCLQTPLVLQCETCNAILKWNVLRLPDAAPNLQIQKCSDVRSCCQCCDDQMQRFLHPATRTAPNTLNLGIDKILIE